MLRLAGGLTQLACAGCLLLGTIAFVLVQQHKVGGAGLVVAWAVAALVGLVFGGLMPRGGLVSLFACAILDAVFGVVLLAIEYDTLAKILKVLPDSDVALIADAVTGIGIGLVIVFALCVLAIPQALRYTRWMHAETQPRLASSTARGFPPPPIPARRGSVWQLPRVAPEESRSRRRMYFSLAGFAIGFGAGIGVLVSSSTRPAVRDAVVVPAGDSSGSGSGNSSAGGTGAGGTGTSSFGASAGASSRALSNAAEPGAGGPVARKMAELADAETTSGEPALRDTTPGGPGGPGGAELGRPPGTTPVSDLIQAQRAALAKGDLAGLSAMLAPTAFGFGADADEVAEGRAALEAHLKKDLGELGTGGASVDLKFSSVGEDGNHAWIALELELDAPGKSSRRFAVTELAAWVDGAWTIVAWHWAVPVADSTAARTLALGTKPSPKPLTSVLTGPKDLESAVRAAFASRAAFAGARSEHDKGFNFGSGPRERISGGAKVKRIFGNLRADIRLHDGVRTVAASAWDPAQKDAPTVAFAAANVDFTTKTAAATDLTHTFRVLAVLLKEDGVWKIVQTQWSHGGPIR